MNVHAMLYPFAFSRFPRCFGKETSSLCFGFYYFGPTLWDPGGFHPSGYGGSWAPGAGSLAFRAAHSDWISGMLGHSDRDWTSDVSDMWETYLEERMSFN